MKGERPDSVAAPLFETLRLDALTFVLSYCYKTDRQLLRALSGGRLVLAVARPPDWCHEKLGGDSGRRKMELTATLEVSLHKAGGGLFAHSGRDDLHLRVLVWKAVSCTHLHSVSISLD